MGKDRRGGHRRGKGRERNRKSSEDGRSCMEG